MIKVMKLLMMLAFFLHKDEQAAATALNTIRAFLM